MPVSHPGPTEARAPIPEALLSLAPRHLPNRRKVRYIGDDLYVALNDLAAADQALVARLYHDLNELLRAIIDPSSDDAGKWLDVLRWTQRHDLSAFIDDVRSLGAASHARGAREAVAQAIHDVRGGALSALLGRLQFIDRLRRNEAELKTLFVLVRDHLKIMRNALTGLDDARRNADREPKSHDIGLMLEKWHDSVAGPQSRERATRVRMDCRHEGALSECCLESAALDRIFYNLANNASRHSAGESMDMVIFPIPGPPPGESLRFVLSNEVNETDAAFLAALAQQRPADGADPGRGASLLALFEPQVSSTGSGFGLTVVAEFVAGAYGLRDRAEALRERYVGAILDGRLFRVWFHWPMANNALPVKTDDFRHPEQSLTGP